MELIPSIAHYFGISIDELFGYDNERTKAIDTLVSMINEMNFKNNGVDINIDECIAIARNAMIENPGNEKIMLCLASVLFNAGYTKAAPMIKTVRNVRRLRFITALSEKLIEE